MRSSIAIYTFLAYVLLAKALPNSLPNPMDAGFSVGITKRYLLDEVRDLEQRAGGTQASIGVVSVDSAQGQWTIDMVVGNQTLPTVLDTGSQDIGQPLYTPTASTSPIPGSTWAAHFGSPSAVASGIAYYETIAIGAATVTSQVVGAATYIAKANTQRKAGIIGLSASPLQYNYAAPRPPSVLTNLQKQMGITQFALDLRYDNGSRLDFGFVDPSRYTGSITYANRDTRYVNWFIALDNVYFVNNIRQTGNMSNTNLTMVDSGTTLMMFPPTIVESYYKSLSGASQDSEGSYYFPCSLVNSGQLPSFGVSVNGGNFTVPGVWMWHYQSGSSCYGSLQSSGNSHSYLGDMFLRTVFAVFDTKGPTGNGQVGFATKDLPTRNPPK